MLGHLPHFPPHLWATPSWCLRPALYMMPKPPKPMTATCEAHCYHQIHQRARPMLQLLPSSPQFSSACADSSALVVRSLPGAHTHTQRHPARIQIRQKQINNKATKQLAGELHAPASACEPCPGPLMRSLARDWATKLWSNASKAIKKGPGGLVWSPRAAATRQLVPLICRLAPIRSGGKRPLPKGSDYPFCMEQSRRQDSQTRAL